MVDVINTQRMAGWCYSRIFKRSSPVKLNIYGDRGFIGSTTANLFRPEMLVNGYHPTGYCGFEFEFPDTVDWDKTTFISFRTPSLPLDLYRIRTRDVPRVVTEAFPPVFFMHIPKTAGTSFNTFVNAYLPKDQAIVHIEALNAETYPAIFKNSVYVSGHLMMRTYRNIPLNTERDLYSIVRSPIHQIHSHLNWMKWIATDPRLKLFTQQEKPFQDLALQIQSTPLHQASVLRDFVAGMDAFALQLFDNLQTRFFLNHMPEKVSMTHLDEARENIRSFKDIGLTEDYTEFVKRFCQAVGINRVLQPEKINPSTMPPLFDTGNEEIRKVLAPLVEVDQELYRHIRDRFRT